MSLPTAPVLSLVPASKPKRTRVQTPQERALAIKPGPKPKKYSFGGGLELYMPVSGKAVWRLNYRLHGKQQCATQRGGLELFSYDEAAEWAKGIKKTVHTGGDPRIGLAEKKSITFREAVEIVWGENKRVVQTKHRQRTFRTIELHLFPTLATRFLRDITKQMLLDRFLVVDQKTTGETRDKMLQSTSTVWSWAIEHGYVEHNVVKDINKKFAFGPKAPVQNAPFVPESEAPAFFRRLTEQKETIGRLALMLLCLTGVRTQELRFIKLNELNLKERIWTVPGARVKKHKDEEHHLVPLSNQAMAIIHKLIDMKRPGCDYLLPHPNRDDRTISENAVLSVISDMGYGPNLKLGISARQTGHGFRRMLSTWGNERAQRCRYSSDAIEVILAHRIPGVKGIYNAALYLDDRRVILQDYANWVEAQSQPAQA